VNNLREPNENAKLWVLSRISKFITDGGGSFRILLEYLDLEYHPAYNAGGMIITNAICTGADECPILRGEDAIAFTKKVAAEENIPFRPVPTPKLDAISKEILNRGKKKR